MFGELEESQVVYELGVLKDFVDAKLVLLSVDSPDHLVHPLLDRKGVYARTKAELLQTQHGLLLGDLR